MTYWVSLARVIAAFAVVILHVSACVFPPDLQLGTANWWWANGYDAATRWAVPVFVMISGGLLLVPGKKESLALFYKKRLSRILVPLIFWSILYLSLTADPLAKPSVLSIFGGRHEVLCRQKRLD